MKKKGSLMLTGIFSVLVAIVWLWFLLLPRFTQDKPAEILSDNLFGWKFSVAKFPSTGSNQLAYSDIRDPGGIPQGLPVRLKIPAISVDSAIEDALITPDGRMDVPAGSKNVAWFALGPHPGQVGSAVIGGHFGISQGVPFVFYRLDQLKIGDKVYIVDDKGDTLGFIVRSISLFNRNADATSVFTSNDGLAHLNLITCEGIWNKVNNYYPQRRVVFTDALSAEDAVLTQIPATPSSARSISIGDKGTDVTVLQTALIQKGFLKMPRGVTFGYFGVLTRAALVKYQTSVGLASTGVFDVITKNKLIPEQPVVTSKPTLPSTAITTPTSTPQTTIELVFQSVKDLYGTPLDGLVTSLLLIAIIFIAYKILKKDV